MPASDIPTGLQNDWINGLLFDGVDINNRIADVSPFAAMGLETYAELYAGTPTFENVGPQSRAALRVDGSAHFKWLQPTPWMGTIVFVMHLAQNGDKSIDPVLIGGLSQASSNARIAIIDFGGQSIVRFLSPAAQLNAEVHRDNVFPANIIAAVSWDAETRKAYYTTDGVTVGESNANASTTHGIAHTWAASTRPEPDQVAMLGAYARIGDVNNSMPPGSGGTNTTAEPNAFCHLHEMHSFKNVAVKDNLADVRTLIENLQTYYVTG